MFALMSHKSAECYNSLFEFIESSVFELKPSSFMCDFETGLRKSLQTIYPNTIISGCWFHHNQAVRSKCRSLKKNFYRLISQDTVKVRIYKKLLLLPLLPQNMIKEGFDGLCLDADVNECTSFFKPIFEYYKKQWIDSNVIKTNLFFFNKKPTNFFFS